jgi:hypothetical protein
VSRPRNFAAMRARRGGRRPVAHAPLGLRASVALYAYLAALAVAFLAFDPPILLIVPFVLVYAVASVPASGAAARRRGITQRPFSRGSDALVGGIAGGVGGLLFGGLASSDSGRWCGLYFLIMALVFDLVERRRWHRVGPFPSR